jgi:uncharacterized protein YdhG (YjbR/CyaY superfamily)
VQPEAVHDDADAGSLTVKSARVADAVDIDEYLADLDATKRATLGALRATIHELVPAAEETIAYGAPAFQLDGHTIAGFAAFKRHLSFLPHSGTVLAALGAAVAGYETSKGALRFAVDDPLPKHLVKKLLDARLRELGLA